MVIILWRHGIRYHFLPTLHFLKINWVNILILSCDLHWSPKSIISIFILKMNPQNFGFKLCKNDVPLLDDASSFSHQNLVVPIKDIPFKGWQPIFKSGSNLELKYKGEVHQQGFFRIKFLWFRPWCKPTLIHYCILDALKYTIKYLINKYVKVGNFLIFPPIN